MGIQERKQREWERRRNQIIVAARRVFSVKGFNKATIEDIAMEAELSTRTIYLYFKNKFELYVSLSIRILQYLLIRLQHINSEDIESPEKKYASLTKAMIDVYEYDPLMLINTLNLRTNETLKNISPELLSEINILSSRLIMEISFIFDQEVNSKVLSDHENSILSETFWALFSGVILFQEYKKNYFGEEKIILKNTLEAAFEIFAHGIKYATFNAKKSERRIAAIN